MEKKRLVVSYQNLDKELRDALRYKYPDGYMDYVIKVTTPSKSFYAVTLDTAEASYLVKVDVKIDATGAEDLEEDNGYGEDESIGTNNDDFDNIPDESDD
ncbi:MAG: hypothetical protein ACLFUC_09195 [Bacteroidales bacterium]